MELFQCCYLFGFLMLFSYIQLTSCYQDGFLSLSCGASTSFIDGSNISWIPDGAFVNSGQTTTIDLDGTSTNVPIRFFPDSQTRKCYNLPTNNLSSPSLVLVRAQFAYKNYDGLSKPPTFFVSLGTALSTNVNLSKKDPWIEEFIWPVNKDVVSLCFQSIQGSGYPVVSSIELRPMPQGSYRSAMNDSPDYLLRSVYRINCGYIDGPLRYPIDQYDRIWDADEDFTPFHVSTGFDIQNIFNLSNLIESPPTAILQTARVLARWNELTYNLPLDHQGDYHIILYFAGILPVSSSFDVMINGNIFQANYTIQTWESKDMLFTLKEINSLNITLRKVGYFPFINALEVYEILDIPPGTSSTTVSALQIIQSSVALDLGWQDDPCLPMPWDHIGCEGNFVTSLDLSGIQLRSINPTFGDLLDLKTLDLHNTSLAGEIQNLGSLQHLERLNLSFNQLTSFGSELESLTNLKILDLRNNSLEGIVPDSLGELQELKLLNLENNKLQGPLPRSLYRKSLEVRTSGNMCLSFSTTLCNQFPSTIETPQVTVVPPKKGKGLNHLEIIVGSVGFIVLALFGISIAFILYSRKKKSGMASKAGTKTDASTQNAVKAFSYKEIRSATNNFKEVIGCGSFGSMYKGKLQDGKQVAVKILFDKCQLSADTFLNEMSLLSQIRHQNLVSLEGFCHSPKQQILVYEYLPGGSLADNLYGSNCKKVKLSWVRRLKIAVDTAKGLDYLHHRCDPRIIHQSVKSSNILLDDEMNAKLADFGLRKQEVKPDATLVTTFAKSSSGYLDPEYHSTRQLTEKSDIYSFGVVLLELICGREPLSHAGSPDSFNLVLWAKPYLQAGGFEVVDESINGTFDEESMRRAALIASRSVERDAMIRPSISEVLAELKKAYSIQISYLASTEFTST
ncbi:hypothetical protein LIER_20239 [Lithospermum erythrorhizon]|uniref:non-specific serine/threonine protein kinase n=1 Tax=Lithospermum erythrorhizon TaxID=34254 RepID=A0AAV3QKT1_LITER